MWTQLRQGKPWQGELTNRSKSGREFVESVLIYPVRNTAWSPTTWPTKKT